MKKVLKILFRIIGISFGVLFTIYMLNLDMKLSEGYSVLRKL